MKDKEVTIMSGSIYGNMFKISTWGESHGKGIGVVVDGCPAGLTINEDIIQGHLNRRKPGQTEFSTPRKEDDKVEIFSGIFNGKTTGTPISMIVLNKTQRSEDYSEIENFYRPGHADYTFDQKYGFRDYRGAGRSSGRETTARVAAGAIAACILNELGIKVCAYTKSIGSACINYNNSNMDHVSKSPLCMPDLEATEQAKQLLMDQMADRDSLGGIIECVVTGMPAGVGDPTFEKLDANLAKAIMSIGAIKGVEIGAGFAVAQMSGSTDNDNWFYDEEGKLNKRTNNAGGILGGISDGSEIILRAAVKPTASIEKTQSTVNDLKENIQVNIKGRHDPIIVPRAVVVVESMVAITIVDMLFMNMTSKLDKIVDFYNR